MLDCELWKDSRLQPRSVGVDHVRIMQFSHVLYCCPRRSVCATSLNCQSCSSYAIEDLVKLLSCCPSTSKLALFSLCLVSCFSSLHSPPESTFCFMLTAQCHSFYAQASLCATNPIVEALSPKSAGCIANDLNSLSTRRNGVSFDGRFRVK